MRLQEKSCKLATKDFSWIKVVKIKLSLLLLLVAFHLSAQQYSVDWYKVAGGGGTSTGGTYSVSGTIGQPDASGAMSGGNYSVTGGFWALINVVQTPGAPTLIITHSGNNVIISWPSPSTGFTLQQNADLNTANWSTAGGVSDNGTIKSLTLTSPTGNLFFRLKQ
jgi:hypothetical protein